MTTLNENQTKTGFQIKELKLHKDRVVGKILRKLPQYFPFESRTIDLCKDARSPKYTAFCATDTSCEKVGICLLVMNNSSTAEIWLLAVSPEFHGQGIGTLLMARAENEARNRGRKYMLVRTISPSQNDPNYLRTFSFYKKLSYTFLFESEDIWQGTTCAFLVKKL